MIDRYLSFSLFAANKAVHQSLAARAKSFGIQIEAWRVLEALAAGEKLTMGRLAGQVLMNPSALSKLVDRMVSDGLVHRKVSPEDQRQIHLLLTALGEKRMKQVREQAEAHDRAIRDLIGEERVAQMQDVLKVLSTLDA